MKRLVFTVIPFLIVAPLFAQSWPQWAQNQQHTGFLNVAGQAPNRILADFLYDPLVPQEQALNGGELLVHYQTPLVDGNDVYMESKAGSYTKGAYNTETWHQNKLTWVSGALTKIWTFDSDWVPPGGQADFWEPVYHAALTNGFLYDPGFAGSIFKVDKSSGTAIKRIVPPEFLHPDGTLDELTYTISPITTDSAGNLYYNALKIPNNGKFYGFDAVNSWLVKVAPDDSTKVVSYPTLLAGIAPAPTDLCYIAFSQSTLPWPPSPDANPPSITCGLQRAAMNVSPAIAPDGTIYTVTKAHFVSRHGHVVAINPDLTLKWATPLKGPATGPDGTFFTGGYFHDGCNDGTAASAGSILPLNGTPGGCRAGARAGVDPEINRFGGGRVVDSSSSTPVIAPDGSVIYGAFSRYNYDQGHLMRFDGKTGALLAFFNFGWDTTPAIYQHQGTYSIITKNNHYSGGSYCDVDAFCPPDRTATNPASPEEFFISQLTPNLTIEWSFKNTNTQSCSRNADGSLTCVSDHPNGFEWCVNADVVDKNGLVYGESEDGNLYVINQGGTLNSKLFQQLALGAAYTPSSLGSDGKIYGQNAGHLFVIGK
jgi:hypothetical protein